MRWLAVWIDDRCGSTVGVDRRRAPVAGGGFQITCPGRCRATDPDRTRTGDRGDGDSFRRCRVRNDRATDDREAPPRAFAAQLRQSQLDAGGPSVRDLERLTAKVGTPYTRGTIQDKLTGRSVAVARV